MILEFGKTQKLVLAGMFAGIIFLLQFTPLGLPQIPLIGSATTLHIPVIIGGIMLGPKLGAALGAVFGFSSMLFATTQSFALNAFAFTPFRPVPGTDSGSLLSLLVAFVPRILVGVVPPLVFAWMTGLARPLCEKLADRGLFAAGKGPREFRAASIAVAAVAGSLTNTLLVLNMIYFFFREPWSYARMSEGIDAAQVTYAFILGMIAGFGIPEAVVAGIVVPAVCMSLFAVARAFVPARQAR